MLGGGAGSILDMIIRYRNNIKMLRKKSIFKREYSFTELKNEYLKTYKGQVSYKTATKEQLAFFRQKFIKQKRMQLIGTLATFFLVICCTYLTIIFILPLSSQNDTQAMTNKNIEQEKLMTKKEKDEKYLFFITDGDNWLKQNHWHNAIFQYKKALELYPNSYDANYRLALAYSYRCYFEKLNCADGKILIDKLIMSYPDSMNLFNLRDNSNYFNNDSIKAMISK